MVRLLIAARANVKASNKRGRTPLHVAAYRRAMNCNGVELLQTIIEMLVATGTDINARDKSN